MASGLVTSGLKAAYNSKPDVTCKKNDKKIMRRVIEFDAVI